MNICGALASALRAVKWDLQGALSGTALVGGLHGAVASAPRAMKVAGATAMASVQVLSLGSASASTTCCMVCLLKAAEPLSGVCRLHAACKYMRADGGKSCGL